MRLRKIPALARGVRQSSGMKSSKALGVAFLSVVIGWSGFSLAELVYAKLPVATPAPQQMAVLALASAAKAQDRFAVARTAAPAVEVMVADRTPVEQLPDPIAVGPAETDATPAPVMLATAPVVAPPEPVSALPAPILAATEPAAVPFEDADLLAAVQQGTIQATLRGNGRERMTAQLRNNSPTPMRVSIAVGQVLEGGRNRVVVTHAVTAELMPARTVDLNVVTAALHSSNMLGDTPYKFSYQNAGRVEGFLQWASEHGGLSAPAMQTAVLALTENLPLRALAKFAQGSPDGQNTDAFRVETGDLIAALNALRDGGAKMETFAIAADPQLRIEAMIEPLSREAAKRYYGITEGMEWEFWKHELLEGSPSTRHYALFGIARFYPDVALEMLPKWARQPQTHAVYRLAAVQALADTQRPEALPVLRALASEFGATSELGKAAAQSADYLDKRLTELVTRPQVVAFRDKSRVTGL